MAWGCAAVSRTQPQKVEVARPHATCGPRSLPRTEATGVLTQHLALSGTHTGVRAGTGGTSLSARTHLRLCGDVWLGPAPGCCAQCCGTAGGVHGTRAPASAVPSGCGSWLPARCQPSSTPSPTLGVVCLSRNLTDLWLVFLFSG